MHDSTMTGRTLFLATLMLLLCGVTGANAALLHQWTFEDGTANDSVGSAHGTLHGNAHIAGGKLVLNSAGMDHMIAVGTANLIQSRTLMLWLSLNDLDQSSVGALTIRSGDEFDGIVYNERAPKQWMNGSHNWARTVEDNGGAPETSTDELMIAITYQAGLGDQTITIYRDGQQYAQYETVLSLFGSHEFQLGVRHIDTCCGSPGYLDGSINEARVYDSALSASEIQAIFAAGPTVPEPASLALLGMGGMLALRRRRA